MAPFDLTSTRPLTGGLRFDDATGRLFDADGSTRLVWISEEFVQALQAVAGRLLHRGARTLLEGIGLEWGASLGARLGSVLEQGARDPSNPNDAQQWFRAVDQIFARHGLGRLMARIEGERQVIRASASFVARVTAATGRPICHLYAGLLADVFGAFHGRDLDCTETRCRSGGNHDCAFILTAASSHEGDPWTGGHVTGGVRLHESGAHETNEIELGPHSVGQPSVADAGAPFVDRDFVSGTAVDRDGTRMFLAPLGMLLGLDRALSNQATAQAERMRYQLGHDWGVRHYRNAERLIAAQGPDETRIPDLPIGELVGWLDHRLAAAGWGRLVLTETAGHIMVRIEHGALAAAASTFDLAPLPTCQLWAGMFAGAYSGAAGTALACAEVQCAATGAEDCQFLLDVEDVVDPIRQLVARGASLTQVLRRLDPNAETATGSSPTPHQSDDAEEPR